jgi:hypothetical protein
MMQQKHHLRSSSRQGERQYNTDNYLHSMMHLSSLALALPGRASEGALFYILPKPHPLSV